MNRKHTCESLRSSKDVGREVTLYGWLNGPLAAAATTTTRSFVKLFDGHGQTQLLIDSVDVKSILKQANESDLLSVTGIVVARPRTQQSAIHVNGDIELVVSSIRIMNATDPYVGPILPARPADESHALRQTSAVGPAKPAINAFTCRTHHCGELNVTGVGQSVTLCGWLQFQRMKKFFTLRDGYGETQCIVPEQLATTTQIDRIPYESIVRVEGKVAARPLAMRNGNMATGEIEVVVESLDVLNAARSNLPMEVRGFNRAKEATRLEFRYIDLRFADMQRNLRLRSQMLMRMREFLINGAGFVEVETPTLFRSTPGVSLWRNCSLAEMLGGGRG